VKELFFKLPLKFNLKVEGKMALNEKIYLGKWVVKSSFPLILSPLYVVCDLKFKSFL
jgi:hypothetical protein